MATLDVAMAGLPAAATARAVAASHTLTRSSGRPIRWRSRSRWAAASRTAMSGIHGQTVSADGTHRPGPAARLTAACRSGRQLDGDRTRQFGVLGVVGQSNGRPNASPMAAYDTYAAGPEGKAGVVRGSAAHDMRALRQTGHRLVRRLRGRADAGAADRRHR